MQCKRASFIPSVNTRRSREVWNATRMAAERPFACCGEARRGGGQNGDLRPLGQRRTSPDPHAAQRTPGRFVRDRTTANRLATRTSVDSSRPAGGQPPATCTAPSRRWRYFARHIRYTPISPALSRSAESTSPIRSAAAFCEKKLAAAPVALSRRAPTLATPLTPSRRTTRHLSSVGTIGHFAFAREVDRPFVWPELRVQLSGAATNCRSGRTSERERHRR